LLSKEIGVLEEFAGNDDDFELAEGVHSGGQWVDVSENELRFEIDGANLLIVFIEKIKRMTVLLFILGQRRETHWDYFTEQIGRDIVLVVRFQDKHFSFVNSRHYFTKHKVFIKSSLLSSIVRDLRLLIFFIVFEFDERILFSESICIFKSG